jgi:hypothetical protein
MLELALRNREKQLNPAKINLEQFLYHRSDRATCEKLQILYGIRHSEQSNFEFTITVSKYFPDDFLNF